MASALQTKPKKNLTCSICMNQLQDPKVLPCLHSYCHKCIVKLTENEKNQTICCPECRSAVKVTDSQHLSDLPSNVFANNLLTAMTLTNKSNAKKIICDNCDSGDVAETRCKDCQVFLCNFCTASHKRARATKPHKIMSIQEIQSLNDPGSIAEKIRCQKHKKVVKLYCKTCQMTICRDCTIVDHREHNYKFVEDVAVEEKKNILTNLGKIKQRREKISEGINALRRFDQGLAAKEQFTIGQINQKFRQISKVIESRRVEMINKTTTLTKAKQQKIRVQMEKLNVSLAGCTSGVSFTEGALKNGNDAQILSMQRYIMDSMKRLQTVKDCIQPTANDDVMFTVCMPVEKAAQFFAVDIADNIVTIPERCTASITQEVEMLKIKSKSAVTIVCKDKYNRRVRHGGQSVKAKFSGIQVSDVITTDNNDGSHTVSFIPQSEGQLKFDAEINGTLAPSCSLTSDVKWVMSDVHGYGSITNKGLTLTGDGQQCWRIGQCYFEGGVHTWNVQLDYLQRGYTANQRTRSAELGVVHCDSDETRNAFPDCERKWVRYIDMKNSRQLDVVLTLNMENQTLTFSNIPSHLVKEHDGNSNYYNRYYYNNRQSQDNMVVKLDAHRVYPYFGTSTSDISITIPN